jgi:hypothetical protein
MNASVRPIAIPESRFARLSRMALRLGVLHVFLAFNLIPILGSVGALIYALFPPVLPWLLWDFVARAPTLALLAIGPCLTLLPLFEPLRRRISSWTPLRRMLLWTALAFWLPIASAETIRAMLIQAQLAAASPQCQRTDGLMVSLRARFDFDIEGGNFPGTWMVRDGTLLLWKDGTLRFEPATDMDRRPELPPACLHGGATG